jgi:hypothetical protein
MMPQAPTATKYPPIVKPTGPSQKSSGPPQPLPGLGTVAKPTPEMMLKKIIEEKPGKKDVEKYFKLRCEEST